MRQKATLLQQSLLITIYATSVMKAVVQLVFRRIEQINLFMIWGQLFVSSWCLLQEFCRQVAEALSENKRCLFFGLYIICNQSIVFRSMVNFDLKILFGKISFPDPVSMTGKSRTKSNIEFSFQYEPLVFCEFLG